MIFRLLICILCVGVTLYAYIDKQNDLTELRIAIPALDKQVKQLRIENHRLQFEIQRLLNPESLLKIAEQPEYSHLRYPVSEDIVIL